MITRSITNKLKNTDKLCCYKYLSTVNKNEVDFFSKLSKHWWDESGEFGLLHKMNAPRVQFILERIEETKKEDFLRNNSTVKSTIPGRDLEGVKALDIGCGGGLLSEVNKSIIKYILAFN